MPPKAAARSTAARAGCRSPPFVRFHMWYGSSSTDEASRRSTAALPTSTATHLGAINAIWRNEPPSSEAST